MHSSEEEVEIEVGSPEIQGLREVKDEGQDVGTLSCIPIGPERIEDLQGEDEDEEHQSDVVLGLL